MAFQGRLPDWNRRRGNHLGQRSTASATVGRTYGSKRSDQITATQPCEEGVVHIWGQTDLVHVGDARAVYVAALRAADAGALAALLAFARS